MAKVRYKFKDYKQWYQKEPEGTLEEKKEAFEIAQSYLYKILDYADKEEPISKEVVDKEKRIFTFCRQGPRAGHYLHAIKGKLLSADVLYMLSSTLPSTQIGDKFGVNPRKVREIRRGDTEEWYPEYLLVRRLKAIIQSNDRRVNRGYAGSIFSISKLIDTNKYDLLYYTVSLRKAKALRKSIISNKEYDRLLKEDILDIIYPIKEIEVIR